MQSSKPDTSVWSCLDRSFLMRRVGKNAQFQNICFTVVLVLLCPAGPWLAAQTDGLHATLNVRETHGVNRSNVAVSSGLPFPRGTLQHNSAVSTRTLSGKPMANQFDVLTRWDDESVKWGLISVFVSELKPYGEFRFHVAESGTSREGGGGADIHRLEQGVRVEYPAVSVTTNSQGLPQSVSLREGDNRIEVLDGDCRLLLLGQPVDPGRVLPDEVRVEEQGAVRTVVRSQGSLSVDEQTSFSFLSRVIVLPVDRFPQTMRSSIIRWVDFMDLACSLRRPMSFAAFDSMERRLRFMRRTPINPGSQCRRPSDRSGNSGHRCHRVRRQIRDVEFPRRNDSVR